jgi:hypothetical protein
LFLLVSSYMHQKPGDCPTARSRLDLLHALARGTVAIDAYHKNTPDKAAYQGHFYSDKAPGTVALALPAFALSGAAAKAAGVGLDSDPGWLLSSWITCVGSVGIVTAIGAGLLFRMLSQKVAPRFAFLTALAVFLGAAPLPYATMLFSHSLVAALMALALWALARPGDGERRDPGKRIETWLAHHRWDLAAGLACGWALASEYTAGIVVLGLLAWLVAQGWRRAVPFCLAAVPPLLLIPAYSWVCFGNPLLLPYSLNPCFPDMREGLYAIKWPSLETASHLLLGPTRGLLFWTPFLAMAGLGYWTLARVDRRLFWLAYAAPLLQVIVMSGRTWDWPAGPTLGPRYLAPILPLLAVPCAFGVQRFPRVGMVLAGYSILATTLATLTNACPPACYYNPLIELHFPLAFQGELAPNLGTLMGLSPHLSVALFYVLLTGGIIWLWRKLPKESHGNQY